MFTIDHQFTFHLKYTTNALKNCILVNLMKFCQKTRRTTTGCWKWICYRKSNFVLKL